MLEIVALIAFFEKLFRVNGNYHLCPGCAATATAAAVAGLPLRVLVVQMQFEIIFKEMISR